MKFIDENKEVLVVITIVMALFCVMWGTTYLSTQPAPNDPLITRRFKVTLITGDKREISFQLNKGSKVFIESWRGAYTLKGTRPCRLGWETKTLKEAVIDVEEIK